MPHAPVCPTQGEAAAAGCQTPAEEPQQTLTCSRQHQQVSATYAPAAAAACSLLGAGPGLRLGRMDGTALTDFLNTPACSISCVARAHLLIDHRRIVQTPGGVAGNPEHCCC